MGAVAFTGVAQLTENQGKGSTRSVQEVLQKKKEERRKKKAAANCELRKKINFFFFDLTIVPV